MLRWAVVLASFALGCDGGDGALAGGGGGTVASTGAGGGAGAGGAGGAGGRGGAGGSARPEPGNAMLLADGTLVPLYPVVGGTAPTRAVGYLRSGSTLRLLDEDGATLWEKEVGDGSLFGGFDFDADGWPDFGLVRSQDSGVACGNQTMLDTWLDLGAGKTGDVWPLVPPTASICWDFSGTVYPTPQWSDLGVLFGAGATLATAPYYAVTGAFRHFDAGAFVEDATFYYPSSASYDAEYVADMPDAHGIGTSFLANSHVANGLVVDRGGEQRLVFWTSGRVVQYAVAPLGPTQLLADTPYLTAGRTDLVGRNYGLVVPDPEQPDALILVAGTSADTVFADMVGGAMAADPWGQIERHVSHYDSATAAVVDRFFSYAHDGGDAYQYEGRVVYPDSPMVVTAKGQPSRLAFNVYEGGHWRLHVTVPGGVDDESGAIFDDLFLWDIRDLDADGSPEWVLSPSRDPSDPDVPGYYFVKWRTLFARWDEASRTLSPAGEHDGWIPHLAATFRQAGKTTSRSFLYPVLTVRNAEGLWWLGHTPDGAVELRPLPAP